MLKLRLKSDSHIFEVYWSSRQSLSWDLYGSLTRSSSKSCYVVCRAESSLSSSALWALQLTDFNSSKEAEDMNRALSLVHILEFRLYSPIVQIIEVRRKFLCGVYSVLSCESHSILVRPALRWSRALAMLNGFNSLSSSFLELKVAYL